MIPDTSCSEYPSAPEETDLSGDVRSIALRGLWPNGGSWKKQADTHKLLVKCQLKIKKKRWLKDEAEPTVKGRNYQANRSLKAAHFTTCDGKK